MSISPLENDLPGHAVLALQPALALEGSNDRKEGEMRKVIVNEFMSLDGVVQAPGAADEDTSGGFEHGGWHLRYFDELSQRRVLEGIVDAAGFLLGGRTYEILAGYWPNAPEDQQGVAEPLNTKPKYVASTTLSEPLEWQNSKVLQGDVAQAVLALKREDGGDLHVIGSPDFVQTLMEHDLVDEYRLMVFPTILGAGKRLFAETGDALALRLVDAKPAGETLIVIYEPSAKDAGNA
jgi:dihydrofolate reductase